MLTHIPNAVMIIQYNWKFLMAEIPFHEQITNGSKMSFAFLKTLCDLDSNLWFKLKEMSFTIVIIDFKSNLKISNSDFSILLKVYRRVM